MDQDQEFAEAHSAYWDQPVSGGMVMLNIASFTIGIFFVFWAANSLCGKCLL
jgi:hypothetical protein